MYALGVFLSSSWGMVIAVILAVLVLGLIAWFTKNLKYVAAAGAVLALFYFAQHQFTAGVDAEVARQVAAKYADLQAKVKLLGDIADDHTARAERDMEEIERLQALVGQTPPNAAIGLNKDAAARVDAIR